VADGGPWAMRRKRRRNGFARGAERGTNIAYCANSDFMEPYEPHEKDFLRGVDCIGVTCVFWCHDGKGKILFHKRSEHCRDEQGRWDPGGGAMEIGETFEECVRREMKEEYDLEPLKIEYVMTKNVLREHGGRKTHWIKNIFWVLVDPAYAKIGEPKKMDAIGWFTTDNLPSPLHSQIPYEVEILKKYLNHET
jgi:ADP-ribose pyrophosphatase YjhB (NUDIX family)